MTKPKGPPPESRARRRFLAGLAATVPAAGLVRAESASDTSQGSSPSAAPPDAHSAAMETAIPEGYTPEEAARYFVARPASDRMVDALRSLGIDYLASNPGSSFRGLHESIVNYGGNRRPEFLTCLHEESSVAMGHGYAKASGKPLAVACHGTVGLQHAAMAVYNAWCDKVPVIIIAGNHMDAEHRRNRVSWAHSVQDAAQLVRDFSKWDDEPASMPHFMQSLVRSYRIAMTPPMGPVVLVVDGELQEEDLGDHRIEIPELPEVLAPQGDSGALAEAAAMLAAAENPVIVADRAARTPAGVDRLVELAEALQAPVIDQFGRMNFPTGHYLNHTARARSLIANADVILGLELTDFWGTIQRLQDVVGFREQRVAKPDVRLISLGTTELFIKPNYQNFSRYQPVDLDIPGDAEASLPVLTEAVKRGLGSERRRALARRADSLREAHEKMRQADRDAARYAWDASPVSTARLCMELWDLIRSRDWSLVSEQLFQSRWPQRLWDMDRHHNYLGGSGGYGVGYGAPAAVGAALAFRERDILTVNIQSDGDLLYAPGVLWTAAHHSIPLLSVMHNNRAYHQEVMHIQRMALRRQRGVDGPANIGTKLHNPDIDFSALAKSHGVWASGSITDPKDLRPALRKALEVIDAGEPALVDVICQPR